MVFGILGGAYFCASQMRWRSMAAGRISDLCLQRVVAGKAQGDDEGR